MKITFDTDIIIKYHVEDGTKYNLPFAKYDEYYFLVIDELKENYKITKLTSKNIEIKYYNYLIYMLKKTDEDIYINVTYEDSYTLEVIYPSKQELYERYNLSYNEKIQIVIDDYINGKILYKITLMNKVGKVIDIKSLKLSSYKNSLRHYIDLKMPKEDIKIVIEYILDKDNKLMYDEEEGYSALNDEEYDLLFKNILDK